MSKVVVKKRESKPVSTKQRMCACSWKHRPDYVCPDQGYDWRCQKCGHQWRSRAPGMQPPISCPKCRSCWWARTRSVAIGTGRPIRKKELVPVPIVGSAYEPKGVELTLKGLIDDEPNDNPELNPFMVGEVYGILPPPPSVVRRMKQEQAKNDEIANTSLYERQIGEIKPVSSRVMDPNELSAEEKARLERLIAKGNGARPDATKPESQPEPENVESKLVSTDGLEFEFEHHDIDPNEL